jgi:predicted helicase
MNIEHEYLEQMQEYKPFEGICLVDTFELAEPEQSTLSFMTEENTARVKRQKEAPIFVVVGNPPYNAGQKEEGDNNKNRKYRYIDGRITATYAKRSAATLLRKLQDPYVKAIIWATERIGNDGVVAFVTNSSFVHEHSLDGMRACLEEEFESIYIVDLLGNVYKNPKIAGTTHNVFGIKNGVCITFFVRRNHASTKPIDLFYTSATDEWRKERKLTFLEDTKSFSRCRWTQLYPDRKHSWLNAGMKSEFDDFLASDGKRNPQGIFEDYCLGISTNRDEYVYGFQADLVKGSAERFAERYNTEVARFIATGRPKKIDEFVRPDAVKWSRNLKRHLSNCDQFVLPFNTLNFPLGWTFNVNPYPGSGPCTFAM